MLELVLSLASTSIICGLDKIPQTGSEIWSESFYYKNKVKILRCTRIHVQFFFKKIASSTSDEHILILILIEIFLPTFNSCYHFISSIKVSHSICILSSSLSFMHR